MAYRTATRAIAMDPVTLAIATRGRGLRRVLRSPGGLGARSPGRGICAKTLTPPSDRRRGRYRLATGLTTRCRGLAVSTVAARRVITGGSLKCQKRSTEIGGATTPGTRCAPASWRYRLRTSLGAAKTRDA